jgi:hypothetical protein
VAGRRYKALLESEEDERLARAMDDLERRDQVQQRMAAITKLPVGAWRCAVCAATTERRPARCQARRPPRAPAARRPQQVERDGAASPGGLRPARAARPPQAPVLLAGGGRDMHTPPAPTHVPVERGGHVVAVGTACCAAPVLLQRTHARRHVQPACQPPPEATAARARGARRTTRAAA